MERQHLQADVYGCTLISDTLLWHEYDLPLRSRRGFQKVSKKNTFYIIDIQ